MTLENAATISRIHVAIDTPSIIPTAFAYIPPLAAGGGIACSCLQHSTYRRSERNTLTEQRTKERGERMRRSDSSQRYASYNIYVDDFD